ncbi:MAG: hypothetical protein J6P21_04140 [Clostridia bacterium]|nr:hypothetical protein [Clostridia bacterium]
MNSKYEASGAFNAQKSSKSGAGVLKPGGTLNIRSDSSGNKFFNGTAKKDRNFLRHRRRK